jgi:protein TonB
MTRNADLPPERGVARSLVALHVDPREPRAPQLPQRKFGLLKQLAASAALHMTVLLIAGAMNTVLAYRIDVSRTALTADQQRPDVRHIVFLAPERPMAGGGGGGGGNQQSGPIRRAQGVGSDPITLRVRKPPPLAPVTTPPALANVTPLPSIVLDAQPLASGTFDQIGLPSSGVLASTSTGPGSGGGVGTGSGTGIGSGQGPGFGPGSGGGTGGGIYRPGGAVSAPRLLKEVKPGYTSEALRNKIQGTVVLEAIVTGDGCTSQIHVVRSLDRGGLDDEAIAAVAQWRFEPGRLAGVPVDVVVRIMLDFAIR